MTKNEIESANEKYLYFPDGMKRETDHILRCYTIFYASFVTECGLHVTQPNKMIRKTLHSCLSCNETIRVKFVKFESQVFNYSSFFQKK
jgi:hypothetical protein